MDFKTEYKIQYFLPECDKQDDLRIPNRIIYICQGISVFIINTHIKVEKTVPILWKYGDVIACKQSLETVNSITKII